MLPPYARNHTRLIFRTVKTPSVLNSADTSLVSIGFEAVLCLFLSFFSEPTGWIQGLPDDIRRQLFLPMNLKSSLYRQYFETKRLIVLAEVSSLSASLPTL